MSRQRFIYVTAFPSLPIGEEPDEWIRLLPQESGGRLPTLPCPVAIRLAEAEDGRLICVGLRVGWEAGLGAVRALPPEQVTSDDLRHIPLGQILDDLAEQRGLSIPLLKDWSDAISTRVSPHSAPRKHPGRRGYSDAFYERVRDLHRHGLQVRPRSVYRYIVENAIDDDGRLMYGATEQDDVQLSREAVARKWVKTARDRGIMLRPQRRRTEDGPSR